MVPEPELDKISDMVGELLQGDPGLFLVDIRIRPTHNLKVFIDGDHGISIDQLTWINRGLYKKLEHSGLFPSGNFSLEVSSPGLEEPLKLRRQYLKNKGRKVEVLTLDGTTHTGVLKEAGESYLILEETLPKSKETRLLTLGWEQIKATKVCIVF